MQFKDALKDQCPVHLQLRFSNNPFATDGHDVFCFGFANSVNGEPYLFVMDGWENSGRFVKFRYFPVIKGYKIFVR